MAYVVGVLVFVVGILVSIALHEVGHMVPAKKFGVRVSQYMVGFGPTLWSRTRGETEYGLKAIPAGGYVRLIGMYAPQDAVGDPPARGWTGRVAQEARAASAEEIRPGEDHRAFYRLSTPKKLVVMLGGPVMNLVIAFVLMGVGAVALGVPQSTLTLDWVSKCVLPVDAPADRQCTASDQPAPAAAAGLRPGDEVVSFGGAPARSWEHLTRLIRAAGGESETITVRRDGKLLELRVTPVVAQRQVLDANGDAVVDDAGKVKTEPVGFLGINTTQELVRQSPLEVPGAVAKRTGQTIAVVGTLPSKTVDLVRSTVNGTPRDTNSVVGVVGIGRFAGEIASAHGPGIDGEMRVAALLDTLAALNIALFAFNLIPLPPLDGGHVAAALWEGARRQLAKLRGLPRPRPTDSARLVPLAYVVFVLLGGLGLLLVYADIVNPVQV